MRLKNIRQKAFAPETMQRLQTNPYLEIWDVDYYSTSDEEDNDEGKESESDSEESHDSEHDENDETATKLEEEKKDDR